MQYQVTLRCGCRLSVSGAPSPVRVVERRAAACPNLRHQPGTRLWLWEILPPKRRNVFPAADCAALEDVTSSFPPPFFRRG